MKVFSVLKRALLYIVRGVPSVVRTHASVTVLGASDLLRGRCALIVGGTRGIGMAMARAFLDANADHVIITGRHAEANEAARDELLSTEAYAGRVHCMVLDYNDVDSFAAVPDTCRKLLQGRSVDILVNNGGVSGKRFTLTDAANWDMVMNTNLRGVYFLSRVMGLDMKERGISGNILNVASSSAWYPAPSPYYVSKWGIRAITPGLAKIFLPYNIVVNCLVPGPTATEMLHLSKENIAAPNLPMGRYTLPEEQASLAVMLVSGVGRAVVGDCLNATGGCGILTIDDNNHLQAYKL